MMESMSSMSSAPFLISSLASFHVRFGDALGISLLDGVDGFLRLLVLMLRAIYVFDLLYRSIAQSSTHSASVGNNHADLHNSICSAAVLD